MTLSSMTGFARAAGHAGAYTWSWEVKSVNGRSLEVRVRLPSGFDGLELPARQYAAERLRRGNVNLALQITRAGGNVTWRLNEALLGELGGILRQAETLVDAAAARLDGLLALKGVIELVEPEESEDERRLRDQAILASLAEALDALAAVRAAEGERLAAVLGGLLGELERLTAAVSTAAAAQPAALQARLRDQVATLLGAGVPLPEERLAQECAMLVAKADVREELDRLQAHLTAARALVDGGTAGGAGRQLDFLCQEFNREANTLCSKAGDVELTRLGLEIKLVIDRLREQVQNIE